MSKMNSLDWSVVQTAMGNLVNGQPGVTSKVVFNAVKGDLGLEDKDMSSFQAALSAAMKDGRVPGYAGARGKGGGLFPADKLPQRTAAPVAAPKVVQLGGSVTMKIKKSGVSLKNGDEVVPVTTLGTALGKASDILASEGLVTEADKLIALNTSLAEKQANIARLIEEKINAIV